MRAAVLGKNRKNYIVEAVALHALNGWCRWAVKHVVIHNSGLNPTSL